MLDVLHSPLATSLFASPSPARLAYTGLDGDPRVIPVGFHWTGEQIVVCTVERSAKVAAITAHPRVAITIDTEGFPPKALLVRGAAAIDMVEGVPEEYLAASAKLVGEAEFPAWEAGVRALYPRMARITITPDTATLLDFETTLPKAVADLVTAAR
ncbi:MAG TPA: pyridoxamine 5'-phosphate oxidase family protein [Pseudonocardia sp.]